MVDEIAALVQLKDVDAKFLDLSRLIRSVPEQIAELTRKVELLREEFATKRAKLEESKVKRRSKEREIDDFSEKIRAIEFKQFEVKTNKEYQALLHEIALLKEKRSHVEGEIIEFMELEESATKELKGFEAKISKEETETSEEKRRLEERLEQAKREMKVVVEDKVSLLSRLSGPIRARYERIAGGKGGMAVAAVRNRACSACFTNLPAQTLNEIRKGTQVINCETCGRMLVWGEET